ncbi:MAG: cyclic nucleotide-binding domain-containing protein [Saprospiraceae bacterium]
MTRKKGDYIFYWDVWITFITTYLVIEVPLGLVINYRPHGFILLFNLVVSLCFIVDIVLHLQSSWLPDYESTNEQKASRKEYMRRWFIIDLLSVIPFELIVFEGRFFLIAVVLCTFRMLKVFRVLSFKSNWEYRINLNPGILRLCFFFYFLLLFMHCIACGWFRIRTVLPVDDVAHEYIKALYWCTTTITTIGYGDIVPNLHRNIEMIYTMIVEFMGVATYGYLIGNIANLITNIDLAKTRHRDRVDSVATFMKSKKMPKRMQERIFDYFNYLWATRKGYDHAAILSDLPESFKYEFTLFLNKSIIEKVPMFKDAEPSLLQEIVICLKPCIYTPGDSICTYGDIGDKMYFINKGSVEVISQDGTQRFAIIGEGDFFGEISLILRHPRNATIRAIEYCDLYSLDKESFDRVASHYPEFEKNIQEMAQERMNQGN